MFEVMWVVGVILLGAFVQGLTGFGLALLSVPLLSLVLDVKVAVPVAGLFGWMITFPLVFKMREHVQWRTCLIMAIASIPGSLLGANLLKYLPAKWILVGMGLILVLSGLHALRSHRKTSKTPSRSLSALAGFLSGTLGASVGEPGPPAIAFSSMQPWTADQAKSSLVFFFMLQMAGAVFGFWHKELLTPKVFTLFGFGIPGFIIGVVCGMRVWNLMQARKINYHHIVHTFLLCIGAFLFFKNLLFV